MEKVIDIGVNLAHKSFAKHWKDDVQRAADAGVGALILTGTSISSSVKCLDLIKEWRNVQQQKIIESNDGKEEEKSRKNDTCHLYCTLGIHPHDAKTWNMKTTRKKMEQLLHQHKNTTVVAMGECGLDYNRNFSSPEQQRHAFREQVQLAYQWNLPLFLHEREAFEDLVMILDQVAAEHAATSTASTNEDDHPMTAELSEQQQQEQRSSEGPPIVIHCFTGSEAEAMTYLQRGYYLGFTGTICRDHDDRSKYLCELIPKLPLDRIMVETDAPFMAFKKRGKRKISYPEDVVDVAQKWQILRDDHWKRFVV